MAIPDQKNWRANWFPTSVPTNLIAKAMIANKTNTLSFRDNTLRASEARTQTVCEYIDIAYRCAYRDLLAYKFLMKYVEAPGY